MPIVANQPSAPMINNVPPYQAAADGFDVGVDSDGAAGGRDADADVAGATFLQGPPQGFDL